MVGVKEFTAIINPPQTAILSVGCLESAVLEREDCSVVTSHYMTSTLSHDVKVISAVLASRWLRFDVHALVKHKALYHRLQLLLHGCDFHV